MGIENVGGNREQMRGRIWERHKGLLVVGMVILAVMGMIEFVKWIAE